MFEGVEILFVLFCVVFIIMNSGYVGRIEFFDNLKVSLSLGRFRRFFRVFGSIGVVVWV